METHHATYQREKQMHRLEIIREVGGWEAKIESGGSQSTPKFVGAADARTLAQCVSIGYTGKKKGQFFDSLTHGTLCNRMGFPRIQRVIAPPLKPCKGYRRERAVQGKVGCLMV